MLHVCQKSFPTLRSYSVELATVYVWRKGETSTDELFAGVLELLTTKPLRVYFDDNYDSDEYMQYVYIRFVCLFLLLCFVVVLFSFFSFVFVFCCCLFVCLFLFCFVLVLVFF